jgi:hypothetical protein
LSRGWLSAPCSRAGARIKQGLAIAPVHLNLKGKNRALVGLGSYIVNAQGGCADCHSCPTYASGHNPFRGQPKKLNAATYLAGGVPFGPFTSRNITPDEETEKPELTFAQFKEVLRKGTDSNISILNLARCFRSCRGPCFRT